MLNVTIDTREQTPWPFVVSDGGARIPLAETVRGTIPAGDYSLAGDEHGFAIERKSIPDYVSSVTRDWDRFFRQMTVRMSHMPARVVLVEGSVADIIGHQYEGRYPPAFVMRRTAELLLAGVAVWFAGGPAEAQGMAILILRERERALNGQDERAGKNGAETDSNAGTVPARGHDDAGRTVCRAGHDRGQGSWGVLFRGRAGA